MQVPAVLHRNRTPLMQFLWVLRLETGSAASDSSSESNTYSRLFGFLKRDPNSSR